MSGTLHTGADFFDALDEYVQAVSHAVPLAMRAGLDELRDGTRESARRLPAWKDLADHIDVWDEDDEVYLGVRDNEAAMRAEYGDAGSPPAPVIRVGHAVTERAANRMDEVLCAHLGIARPR